MSLSGYFRSIVHRPEAYFTCPPFSTDAATIKTTGNRGVKVWQCYAFCLFQTADTGSSAKHGAIEEVFAPVALQIIGDWLTQHIRR